MKTLFAFLLCFCLAAPLPAQKRKNKKKDEEPKPQVLPVLPDLPEALTAETGRLTFYVSPLSDKGLLSQQVRDALKALIGSSRGGTIIKLRAFVAGSGDLRRVREIVTEEFTDRKLSLPIVSTLQAGVLPMVGAQVVIESTVADKKVVNPNGVALFSGIPRKDPAAAVAELQQAAKRAGVQEMSSVTCFLSSIADAAVVRGSLSAAFPGAALNLIQPQRLGIEQQTNCEGVGRLGTTPPQPVSITKEAALMNTPRLVFTTVQLVFRDQDSDFQLAVQRLAKTLSTQQVTMKDVVWIGAYSLTRQNAAKADGATSGAFDPGHLPASTSLLFEGLPSTDATAAVEVIAARN